MAFRSAASGSAGWGANPITVTKPTGTVSGDTLLAFVLIDTWGGLASAPSGWTLDPNNAYPITCGSTAVRVYRRIAGGSEPGSYAWTLNGGTMGMVIIQCFSGRDGTNPWDASLGQNNASGPGNTVAPSISPANTNCDLAGFFFKQNGANPSHSPPTGMTESHDTGVLTIGASACYEVLTASGATGTRTATAAGGATGASFGYLAALKDSTPSLVEDYPLMLSVP
jgi:hypothetical protein